MNIRIRIMVALATLLAMATFNARAARIDEPEKPGDSDCPVKKVTIAEKNGKVMMTFRISGTYNWDYVFKKAWFGDKNLKHKKLFSGQYELKITVPKDKMAKAWLSLSYVDPNVDPQKDKTGGGMNDVRLKVSMYYEHYKKPAQK